MSYTVPNIPFDDSATNTVTTLTPTREFTFSHSTGGAVPGDFTITFNNTANPEYNAINITVIDTPLGTLGEDFTVQYDVQVITPDSGWFVGNYFDIQGGAFGNTTVNHDFLNINPGAVAADNSPQYSTNAFTTTDTGFANITSINIDLTAQTYLSASYVTDVTVTVNPTDPGLTLGPVTTTYAITTNTGGTGTGVTKTGLLYTINVLRAWPETQQLDPIASVTGLNVDFTLPVANLGAANYLSTEATTVTITNIQTTSSPAATVVPSLVPTNLTADGNFVISFENNAGPTVPIPPGVYTFDYKVEGNVGANDEAVKTGTFVVYENTVPATGTDQAIFTFDGYPDTTDELLTNGVTTGVPTGITIPTTGTSGQSFTVNPGAATAGSGTFSYEVANGGNPVALSFNYEFVGVPGEGTNTTLKFSISTCSSPSGNNKSQYNQVRSNQTDNPVILANMIVEMISYIIRTNILPNYTTPVINNSTYASLFYDPTATISIVVAKQNVYDFFLKYTADITDTDIPIVRNGTYTIDPTSSDGIFIMNRIDAYFLKVREILKAMHEGGTSGAINFCAGDSGAGTSLCVKDCVSAMNFIFSTVV